MEDEKMIRAVLAGHALQGLIAGRMMIPAGHGDPHTLLAAEAVRLADALLVQLNKDSPTPAEDCPPPLHDAAGVGDVVEENNVGELNDCNATIIRAAPVTRWGRVADAGAAWHVWREGAGEAECGEATEAEIELLPANTGMDPEHVCLDCKAIAATLTEDALSFGLQGERFRRENPPDAPQRRCAGFNKSARIICNTVHVHFERGGRWFCKRHDPEKPKRAKAQEVAA